MTPIASIRFVDAVRAHGAGVLLALLAGLLLAACSTTKPPPPSDGGRVYPQDRDGAPSHVPIDVHAVPDAVPRVEPRSRYGNPPSYVVFGQEYRVMDESRGYVERGTASWYGTKFHGQRTSSGEPYDMYAMTAAHRSLPLPSYARVTNLDNGRSVVVRVNDRGPFHSTRLIDLSYTAAAKLDILRTGTGRVEVRAIDPRAPQSAPPAATARAEPPAAPAAADAKGRMYLQVGAFSDPGNAEQLRARLAQAQLGDILVSPSERAGGTIYRVRIGPLAGAQDVDRITRSLGRMGIQGTQVIVD